MNRPASTLKGFALTLTLFSLLALSVGLAYGQAISGNLVGTLLDSSGAAVPNAEVTAMNVGTAQLIPGRTNSTGEFRFDNLPIGTYKISAKASGFRTTTVEAEVQLNKTGTVNLTLIPGAARRSKSQARRRSLTQRQRSSGRPLTPACQPISVLPQTVGRAQGY